MKPTIADSVTAEAPDAAPFVTPILTFGPEQLTERRLVTSTEPLAFVYFGLDAIGEDARELRWSKLVQALKEQGATDEAVHALEARMRAESVCPATLAAFATDSGELVHSRRLRLGVTPDSAGHRTPVAVRPLVAASQARPPYLLAVVDRTGADLTAGAGADSRSRSWTVAGPDDEIEHNAPGGWSQPRYQSRAEDSWRHNAAAVAAQIQAHLDEVNAEVLVLGGDVRAVQLVRKEFPPRPGLLMRTISAGRSRDGSQAHRGEDLELILEEAACSQTGELLSLLRDRVAPHGAATVGIRDTLDALTSGRVATLLIADHDDSRTAWYADAGAFVDHDSAAATGQPVGSGPLTDVAIRAALQSAARVRVVPEGTPELAPDGIGAVCRFAP